MPYLASWEKSARKEGKKEGKIEGKIETAKRMLEKGFALDTVIDITGLNKQQIENLIPTSH